MASASIDRPCPVSEWCATIRINAPSSARMLSVTRSAISSRTSSLGELDAVEDRALAQDRDAGREVGWADVGDESGFEALAQTFLDRQRAGGAGDRR